MFSIKSFSSFKISFNFVSFPVLYFHRFIDSLIANLASPSLYFLRFLFKSFKVPKLRFPEFNDEWIKYKLLDISRKITQKNIHNINRVISNSAVYGLIAQEDFFDKDIANDENINKYLIIKKGDFVYNPRKSIRAPYGPINVLENYDEGIVSPLYTCFNIDKNYTAFLKFYFKSSKWHRYIYINGDKGARGDRVSIKDNIFYRLTFYAPSKYEIDKISDFLTLIEKKIILLNRKIETLKKYKKGLMYHVSKKCKTYSKISDLVEICDKTHLQSSYGSGEGTYPFFINSTDNTHKKTNDFIFDGEYLILNTGGSAYCNYYNGKFSAMSDCLVLKPKEKSMSIYFYLKITEKKINLVGFQGTGLKHLDQDWMLRQRCPISIYENNYLRKINFMIDNMIRLYEQEYEWLLLVKRKLLMNIFI